MLYIDVLRWCFTVHPTSSMGDLTRTELRDNASQIDPRRPWIIYVNTRYDSLHQDTRSLSVTCACARFCSITSCNWPIARCQKYNEFSATCSPIWSVHYSVADRNICSITLVKSYTDNIVHLWLLSSCCKMIRHTLGAAYTFMGFKLRAGCWRHAHPLAWLFIYQETDWFLPSSVHTINVQVPQLIGRTVFG